MKQSDKVLAEIAQEVGLLLGRTQRTIATAESCTGGFIAKCLTDIAGSSAWFGIGLVTYSNSSKEHLLGVPTRVLRVHGAVSAQTAAAMCRGALRISGAAVSVSVTGIAGPSGAVPGKPVGTVYFGWGLKEGRKIRVLTAVEHFRGGRDAVRRHSVECALRGVLRLIQ